MQELEELDKQKAHGTQFIPCAYFFTETYFIKL